MRLGDFRGFDGRFDTDWCAEHCDRLGGHWDGCLVARAPCDAKGSKRRDGDKGMGGSWKRKVVHGAGPGACR